MVRYAQKKEDDKEKKITFFAKEPSKCPVCEGSFHREELFQGRVNAGDLTEELHRTYIPRAVFGEVHPLVYETTVCPNCYFAVLRSDFGPLPQKLREPLMDSIEARVESAQRIFPKVDFAAPRGLMEGAAGYFLSMICYDKFTKEYAPTAKMGICALRGAWLCNYLDKKAPGSGYDYAAGLLYRKARFLYRVAIEYEQKGAERLSAVKWLGPDTDKNYGYEGVLYLAGLLEMRYGPRGNAALRAASLDASKRTIAKMFGLGRKTKSKPGPLLDKARDLYDKIKAELHEEGDEADE